MNMKINKPKIILSFLLLLVLSGCYQTETETETESSLVWETFELTTEIYQSIPHEIRNAIDGKTEFYYQGERVNGLDELEIEHMNGAYFSLIDFEEDNTPEMLLNTCLTSYIFHVMDGQVYVYSLPFRTIAQPLNDGSFAGSGSAFTTTYYEFSCFSEKDFIYIPYLIFDAGSYYDQYGSVILESDARLMIRKHEKSGAVACYDFDRKIFGLE